MRLSSIVFHTSKLEEIREFYEEKLGLKIGTYEKDDEKLPDYSETYVNYDLDGILLCFEFEQNRTDLGTIVLTVPNIANTMSKLRLLDINIVKSTEHWIKIKDPEGRSLLLSE